MDLLRAVILGAPGTPYHDGLFVFDLYLPPEYPHTPPVRFLYLIFEYIYNIFYVPHFTFKDFVEDQYF